jgi:hypothetical protein
LRMPHHRGIPAEIPGVSLGSHGSPWPKFSIEIPHWQQTG